MSKQTYDPPSSPPPVYQGPPGQQSGNTYPQQYPTQTYPPYGSDGAGQRGTQPNPGAGLGYYGHPPSGQYNGPANFQPAQQPYYQQQGQPYYGQQQPQVVYQQDRGYGSNVAGGAALGGLAGLCALCACFDLSLCCIF